ncbi:MAG: hypothetical protein Q9209_005765 [Squamulea sp. 1 TL-2023]
MAPEKSPRRIEARSRASSLALATPATVTPSSRPNRPPAILTTPRTPLGPTEVDSDFSSGGVDTSSRSSTRSGRSYLPADTGILPGHGRRRSSVLTNHRMSSAAFSSSSGILETSFAGQSERFGTPTPGPSHGGPSSQPAPDLPLTDQDQSPNVQSTQSVKDIPVSNSELQEKICLKTNHFQHLQSDDRPSDIQGHSIRPNDIRPNHIQVDAVSSYGIRPDRDQPAAAAPTATIVRRTTMERELMHFLSLPHEERHALHLANPFAVPEDMEEWVRNNLGSRSPSPPLSPRSRMENRSTWCMPPHAGGGGSFADSYWSTIQGRGDLSEAADEGSELGFEPAMSTASPLPGITVPPRSKSMFPHAATEVKPTIYDDALRQAACDTTSRYHENRRVNYCIRPDCPVSPMRHHQGRYLHNDQPAQIHLPTFGTSNPPPCVWQAIYQGCRYVGTQQDADLISHFLEYHVDVPNISVVPDTNFIWSHEIHSRHVTVQRPYVQLPFPAVPLRVRFDAEQILLAMGSANNLDALGRL